MQAAGCDSDRVVTIRVLPVTYATDPFAIIIKGEWQRNLRLAEGRVAQVLDACTAVVAGPTACALSVVDVQVRDDASDPTHVALLADEAADGVFILGGDQTVAMQVMANTPTEDVLEALYRRGAPISRTSAGVAVQSRYMIAVYTGNYSAWDGLEWDTVDLWYGPPESATRGLCFGLEAASVDWHYGPATCSTWV